MRGRAPGAIRGGIARETRTILFGGARRRRRRRIAARLTVVVIVGLVAGAAIALVAAPPAHAALPQPDGHAGFAPAPPPDDGQGFSPGPMPLIDWRASEAVGMPWAGRLVRSVKLPKDGPDWFTWDPVLNRTPDRWWRRFGTDALVRTVLKVVREYREANPGVPRVGIGDLSRPQGGYFGKAYGGLGHASHQNGRDVDVWYPRKDWLERRAFHSWQVDRALAQDLVDRFVEAGAEQVFVGPSLGLRGPRRVVIALVHHDDHLHVRMPAPVR